ncbi:MAG: insulinase family protein, partial [Actinobacteria bacterium]|nr:insulinase family protein [Actinomycetota bacterium]
LEELGKVASDGISTEELALAKGNISGGLALKFESSQAKMSRLSSAELSDGEFNDLDEVFKRYEAVSLEDVQQVAKAMFEFEHSFVAVGELQENVFDEFI